MSSTTVLAGVIVSIVDARTYRTRLREGKPQQGACTGLQMSQHAVGCHNVNTITVAAVRANAVTIAGQLGGTLVEMMLDSGSGPCSSLGADWKNEHATQLLCGQSPDCPSDPWTGFSARPLPTAQFCRHTVAIHHRQPQS